MNSTGASSSALLEILGDEQRLAALRLGVEHGDADDLRGERPQAHEPRDFLALGVLGDGVVNLLGLAEEVFLLRLVELFERQRGGFDVENECGHKWCGTWCSRPELNRDQQFRKQATLPS